MRHTRDKAAKDRGAPRRSADTIRGHGVRSSKKPPPPRPMVLADQDRSDRTARMPARRGSSRKGDYRHAVRGRATNSNSEECYGAAGARVARDLTRASVER